MKAAARPGCTVTTQAALWGRATVPAKTAPPYKYGLYGEPDVTTGSRFRYIGQQPLGPLNLYD